MKTFQQFIESKMNPNDMNQYAHGWDDTVYALKDWGLKNPPKETPQEYCQRNIMKLKQISDNHPYTKGALEAMESFLKNGKIDYIGTSYTGNTDQSPFSIN